VIRAQLRRQGAPDVARDAILARSADDRNADLHRIAAIARRHPENQIPAGAGFAARGDVPRT
jgi:hypothetical protein